MSGFLKIAIRNLLKGPVTDPYPFGDTFIPDKLRGKLKVDAKACTACGTCEEVCPSGAIHITKNENAYVHTTWYNTCCFCGNCEFFCPTGAIKLTNDFHTANTEEEKYRFTTVAVISEIKCESCGRMFVPASEALLKRAYPNVNETIKELTKLCSKCRQKKAFERLYK
ncbi:4Fe-4S binding protein [Lebetimonas sp. JH292]|uniref:4Fe-4S binding protein n=1 Tax=Lebetimonas sp. JH292 TaxID=990068 RepID=UPI0004634A3F|nr:4Fe-4S binding protein [Lebetimonas sp. JH292]